MSHVVKIILLACLLILASCSNKKEDAAEPEGIKYKASEITVRQCSDIANQEFNALLTEHDVVIKKQMSPHLYIVTWDDGRSADAVVSELKNTTMFCGVDKFLQK